MFLLSSNFPPAAVSGMPFNCVFENYISKSDHLRIATGYVASEALAEIESMIRENPNWNFRFELILGMHKFEGFTRQQYNTSCRLHNYLVEKDMGGIRICTAFPYHGKVYLFQNNGSIIAGSVGSSNLSSILDNHLLYETDVLFSKNDAIVFELSRLMTKLWDKASIPLDSFANPIIKQSPSKAMEGISHVDKLPKSQVEEIKSARTGATYQIALKDTPKSNLNVYFGKGRLTTKTGLIRPRHWYEVEIIVSKEVTQLPGYPEKGVDFFVVTDDGWKFECNVNGDYSKNFRSSNNLQILGRWVKGRLEDAGCLTVGEPVTEEVYSCYGRSHMSLEPTADPNIWYLDFSRG